MSLIWYTIVNADTAKSADVQVITASMFLLLLLLLFLQAFNSLIRKISRCLNRLSIPSTFLGSLQYSKLQLVSVFSLICLSSVNWPATLTIEVSIKKLTLFERLCVFVCFGVSLSKICCSWCFKYQDTFAVKSSETKQYFSLSSNMYYCCIDGLFNLWNYVNRCEINKSFDFFKIF